MSFQHYLATGNILPHSWMTRQQDVCYDSPSASSQVSLQVSNFITHSLILNYTEYHWFFTFKSMRNISFLSLFIYPWDGGFLTRLIQVSGNTWPSLACSHNLLRSAPKGFPGPAAVHMTLTFHMSWPWPQSSKSALLGGGKTCWARY